MNLDRVNMNIGRRIACLGNSSWPGIRTISVSSWQRS